MVGWNIFWFFVGGGLVAAWYNKALLLSLVDKAKAALSKKEAPSEDQGAKK